MAGNHEPSGYGEDRPYWPDFVIEDYAAVVEMVGRYALYTGVPNFTFGQLEGHLIRLNVELTGESDWPTLFAEMQKDVVRQLEEQGRHYQWRQEVGERTLYSLVEIAPSYEEAATSLKQTSPTQEPEQTTIQQSGTTATIRSGEHEASERRLITILNGLPEHKARPKELLSLVMGRYGVDKDEAEAMIHAARSDGSLHRYTIGGTTYLSSEPPSDSSRKSRQVARHEDTEKEARPLNDDELAAATRIMDMLAARGTHVSEGSTIKRLEQDLHLGLTPTALRRLLRHMESMRFITVDNTSNYRQARKSPKVRVRGQDMKTRWVGNRDGYISRLRKSRIID